MLVGVMAPAVAVKVLVTPTLVGAAGLAGRRWGEQVGGWLVALPLTSGPVAFFLAQEQGTRFAARAAVAMMAGTVSQVAFALAYRHACGRSAAGRRWAPALVAGIVAFAVCSVVLSRLRQPAVPTFALVAAVLLVARRAVGRRRPRATPWSLPAPWWELPVRMAVTTGVVLAVTAVAPLLGAHRTGLLSPFPVFGAVLAVAAHRTAGAAAAADALAGLVVGLASPTAFFLVLALGLPVAGIPVFGAATLVALLVQAGTARLVITAGPAGVLPQQVRRISAGPRRAARPEGERC